MEGPPLGPGGEDITWPDQVAPRGRKASSTRKIKPQTSNLKPPSSQRRAQPLRQRCHEVAMFNMPLTPEGRPAKSSLRMLLHKG